MGASSAFAESLTTFTMPGSVICKKVVQPLFDMVLALAQQLNDNRIAI
jgi:hypothetical protein